MVFFLSAVVREASLLPYDSFERATYGGAFDVTGWSSDMEDFFPPSKISNLQSEGKIEEEKVQIMWTAVGDSMDYGTGIQ